MASFNISSCWSIAWFVIWQPVASSMMTCARRRALCRLDSTSGTFGLELLLMTKFMDLEASSPRTAEIKISIRVPLSLQDDNPAGGGENEMPHTRDLDKERLIVQVVAEMETIPFSKRNNSKSYKMLVQYCNLREWSMHNKLVSCLTIGTPCPFALLTFSLPHCQQNSSNTKIVFENG